MGPFGNVLVPFWSPLVSLFLIFGLQFDHTLIVPASESPKATDERLRGGVVVRGGPLQALLGQTPLNQPPVSRQRPTGYYFLG